MKRFLLTSGTILLLFTLTACSNETKNDKGNNTIDNALKLSKILNVSLSDLIMTDLSSKYKSIP